MFHYCFRQRIASSESLPPGLAMANLYSISRCMVGALRHGHHGAVTDEAGWMLVATLVALPRFVSLEADQQSIQEVIRMERKKRFETEIRGGDLYIRVKQGWSLSSGVNVERALPPVLSACLPDFLVHASFLQYQQSILSHGLLCGSRLQKIGGPSRSHVHWFPCKSITLLEAQRALKRDKTLLVVVRPKVLEAHGVRMFQAHSRRKAPTLLNPDVEVAASNLRLKTFLAFRSNDIQDRLFVRT